MTTVSPVTLQPSPRNIIRVFEDATAEQREAGMSWYRDAHGAAASLDPDNPRRAAGVIAALSPQTSWPRNLELAARAYADGKASGTLGRSVAQADAILAGADPLDALRGPKVRAFFALIADPDDPDTVVIDRHAVDIAVGKRQAVRERDQAFPLARRGRYARFADTYRKAARRLGVTAGQAQAVTWVAWRDQYAGTRTPAGARS